uniref:Uncharacterized protein n=1 Tax=Populus alba TaxID=43335 RepID=A0A4U5MX54_POPAL|nr:hypothetical protein D5086_0000293290 [Populus alba]
MNNNGTEQSPQPQANTTAHSPGLLHAPYRLPQLILDSGATDHITSSPNLLVNSRQNSILPPVTMPSGEQAPITSTGTLPLNSVISLKNVLGLGDEDDDWFGHDVVFHEHIFPYKSSPPIPAPHALTPDFVAPSPVLPLSIPDAPATDFHVSNPASPPKVPLNFSPSVPSNITQSSPPLIPVQPLRRSQRHHSPPPALRDYICNQVTSPKPSLASSSGSSKGTRYPLCNFLSYHRYSPQLCSYTAIINQDIEPRSYTKAASLPQWQAAMQSELYDWCIPPKVSDPITLEILPSLQIFHMDATQRPQDVITVDVHAAKGLIASGHCYLDVRLEKGEFIASASNMESDIEQGRALNMEEDKPSSPNKGKDIDVGSASENMMTGELFAQLDSKVKGLPSQHDYFECCIYRVSKRVQSVQWQAYSPLLISIGPLHRDDKKRQVMENEKLRYYRTFIERVGMDKEKIRDIMSSIQNQEERLRNCYSEEFKLTRKSDFIEMVMLDAVFIIEFMKEYSNNDEGPNRCTNSLIKSHI